MTLHHSLLGPLCVAPFLFCALRAPSSRETPDHLVNTKGVVPENHLLKSVRKRQAPCPFGSRMPLRGSQYEIYSLNPPFLALITTLFKASLCSRSSFLIGEGSSSSFTFAAVPFSFNSVYRISRQPFLLTSPGFGLVFVGLGL